MNSTYFHVFIKEECKYCIKAKNLLEERELAHVVTNMDKAPEALEELKEQCSWKTIPIIFEVLGEQETFVGGYTDLEEYLNGASEGEKSCGEETNNIEEG